MICSMVVWVVCVVSDVFYDGVAGGNYCVLLVMYYISGG